jgi:hypothetical protein
MVPPWKDRETDEKAGEEGSAGFCGEAIVHTGAVNNSLM